MMIKIAAVSIAALTLLAGGALFGPTAFRILAATPESNWEAPVKPELLTASFEDMQGNKKSLKDFDGQVVMIVNTASRCGFTPQYAELEKLFNEHKDNGFVILAFPANNFGNQEPGTNEQIAEFCQVNYGVTFPVMAKLDVVGDTRAPLFEQLTGPTSPLPGDIRWNFEKFLVDREGRLVARFPSRTRPLSDEVTQAVSKALGSAAGNEADPGQ